MALKDQSGSHGYCYLQSIVLLKYLQSISYFYILLLFIVALFFDSSNKPLDREKPRGCKGAVQTSLDAEACCVAGAELSLLGVWNS